MKQLNDSREVSATLYIASIILVVVVIKGTLLVRILAALSAMLGSDAQEAGGGLPNLQGQCLIN